MTPFRLRERVKSALGLGTPRKREREAKPQRGTAKLVFLAEDQRFEADVPVDATIQGGTSEMTWMLGSGCNDSTCSTCRVEVIAGEELLSAKSDRERRTLAANGRPDHYRLGCVAAIERPGRVEVRGFEFNR
jgi:ferredoxin